MHCFPATRLPLTNTLGAILGQKSDVRSAANDYIIAATVDRPSDVTSVTIHIVGLGAGHPIASVVEGLRGEDVIIQRSIQ